MTQRVYRPEDKHPDEWRQDLSPDASAGINYGGVGPHPEKNNPRTAYDVKEAHQHLREFTDDQLKQLPILPVGARLEQDAVYLDLNNPAHQEVRAMGYMEAGPDNLYVPKSEVDYQLWNKLRGVTDPVRTGEGGVKRS